MTDVLLSTMLDADQRDCAETIRFSGETLLTILSDILDFSKIEAGRLNLESIELDPGATVRESLKMVASAAAQKGLTLDLTVADGVPARAFGDPTRLRQILLNLLTNAIKFTESGGIRVSLAAAESKESKLGLSVEVVDTGVGISPENQKKQIGRAHV